MFQNTIHAFANVSKPGEMMQQIVTACKRIYIQSWAVPDIHASENPLVEEEF
jgi:hypothetical protein